MNLSPKKPVKRLMKIANIGRSKGNSDEAEPGGSRDHSHCPVNSSPPNPNLRIPEANSHSEVHSSNDILRCEQEQDKQYRNDDGDDDSGKESTGDNDRLIRPNQKIRIKEGTADAKGELDMAASPKNRGIVNITGISIASQNASSMENGVNDTITAPNMNIGNKRNGISNLRARFTPEKSPTTEPSGATTETRRGAVNIAQLGTRRNQEAILHSNHLAVSPRDRRRMIKAENLRAEQASLKNRSAKQAPLQLRTGVSRNERRGHPPSSMEALENSNENSEPRGTVNSTGRPQTSKPRGVVSIADLGTITQEQRERKTSENQDSKQASLPTRIGVLTGADRDVTSSERTPDSCQEKDSRRNADLRMFDAAHSVGEKADNHERDKSEQESNSSTTVVASDSENEMIDRTKLPWRIARWEMASVVSATSNASSQDASKPGAFAVPGAPVSFANRRPRTIREEHGSAAFSNDSATEAPTSSAGPITTEDPSLIHAFLVDEENLQREMRTRDDASVPRSLLHAEPLIASCGNQKSGYIMAALVFCVALMGGGILFALV